MRPTALTSREPETSSLASINLSVSDEELDQTVLQKCPIMILHLNLALSDLILKLMKGVFNEDRYDIVQDQ